MKKNHKMLQRREIFKKTLLFIRVHISFSGGGGVRVNISFGGGSGGDGGGVVVPSLHN